MAPKKKPLAEDPITLFKHWFDEATSAGIKEPEAVNIATATKDGRPSNRMVLLKHVDEQGFVFYTNMESRKGSELIENPYISMCFYWEKLGKQVRVEGTVKQVSDEEADSYYHSRPLKSQIGAWVSKQSRPIDSQTDLLKELTKKTAEFATGTLKRPPYWSGFRVTPERIEFWTKGDFRLHMREVYLWEEESWQTQHLYP